MKIETNSLVAGAPGVPFAFQRETSSRTRPLTAIALLTGALVVTCDDAPSVFAVTTTSDGGDGSLRAAITAANSADPSQPIRIEVPAGAYDLTACGADDSNAGGDLDVTTNAAVSLVAPSGASVVIRQTCANERVLDARGTGRLTLVGITITGGSVEGTEQLAAQGGGVRAAGDVTLQGATIAGNAARWYLAFTGSGPAAQGGGLYVGGSLASASSVISDNSAAGAIGYAFGGTTEGGGAYVVGGIWMAGGAVSNNSVSGTSGGLARGGGLAQASGSTGVVVLSGATLANNSAQGGSAWRNALASSAGNGIGGAIAAFGPLMAANVTLTGNRAFDSDSTDQAGSRGGAATGGAVAGESTLDIRSSTFSGNRAQSGFAPAYSATQGLFTGPARGGALWASGDMTLSESTFDGNAVSQPGFFPVPASRGGAVRGESALTVDGGQFTNNTAIGSGGALSGGAVSLTDVTFSANIAQGRSIEGVYSNSAAGGAVDAATLIGQRITATDNRVDAGYSGGAVFVAGDATLDAAVLRNNSASFFRSYFDPVHGGGGGVYAAGKLVISNSTLFGNGGTFRGGPSRLCGPSCPGTFAGGGAWAGSIAASNVTAAGNYALGLSHPTDPTLQSGGGAFGSSGAVTLVNTTLSGNLAAAASASAGSSAHGAAVLAGNLSLEHVTALDNEGVTTLDNTQVAIAPRAALASLKATSLTTRRSSIVAPTGSVVCAAGTQVTSSADSSYNWFSDATCNLSGSSDQQSATGLAFAALADNGGPVQTRLPADGSPLIDYIPALDCPITSDARGVTRPQGPACDVGAVEITQ